MVIQLPIIQSNCTKNEGQRKDQPLRPVPGKRAKWQQRRKTDSKNNPSLSSSYFTCLNLLKRNEIIKPVRISTAQEEQPPYNGVKTISIMSAIDYTKAYITHNNGKSLEQLMKITTLKI